MACKSCGYLHKRTGLTSWQRGSFALVNRQLKHDDVKWLYTFGDRLNFIVSTVEQKKYSKSFAGAPIVCACEGSGLVSVGPGYGASGSTHLLYGQDKQAVESEWLANPDSLNVGTAIIVCRDKVEPFEIEGTPTIFVKNLKRGHQLPTTTEPHKVVKI